MGIQKITIIQAFWQIPLILLIALAIGIGFNQFRSNPLPMVCNWTEVADHGLSISLTKAARLFQQNKAVFLDARPADFYDQGHIKGALSLPWNMVDEKIMEVMDKIPSDATIITYCDGATCELSEMLAEYMIDMGFEDVHTLINGWTLWNQQNLPVEGVE
ncbi:MAG: rhodanese-like domain-containing protein [Desulfobacterales bacterium]|jgi:rhodanese-related sulfurtransferase|nr:rhodanese-like domain-containing protein [Desulfobacterales bacterium]